jgi:hypothetical protein
VLDDGAADTGGVKMTGRPDDGEASADEGSEDVSQEPEEVIGHDRNSQRRPARGA